MSAQAIETVFHSLLRAARRPCILNVRRQKRPLESFFQKVSFVITKIIDQR
jgi:hypothetical protein